MMVLVESIVFIVCVINASAKEASKTERCDVPDKALLEQKLDKVLNELPEEYVVPNTAGDSLLRGAIFLESTRIRGLDRLLLDRPYKTFCRGDDRVTLFSLRTRSPVRVTIPWRLCSGHNGTVLSNAGTARYEGEMITRKSSGGIVSKIDNLSVVQLENVYVGLTGGGGSLDTAVNILGHLFSGPVRLYWTEEMKRHFKRALSDALEAAQ